ncbi:MAG: hypothetical protein NWE98_12060 [Candidatus Bathyarchaeota archaeon]|nr:hypothetical protein [Candidatus Bathyarchaeota archaeon]
MKRTKVFIAILFLTLTITLTLIPLQTVTAHYPEWVYPTWCYCVVGNNIIGVGQTQKIIFWINSVPPTANGQYGDRWKFMIDIIRPDGRNDTLGPITSDPVGSAYAFYTPDTAGNYTVVVKFSTTVITGLPKKPGVADTAQQGYAYINDTYLASVSDPTPFTVQDEPIPLWPETPLPTEYWTRPINCANIYWYQVAGNWLGGAAQNVGPTTNFAYGKGPESAHVMWSTSVFTGGLMDERFGDYGYATSHYEGISLSPLVLDGKVFFNAPNSGMKMGWYCLDLYTGKQLYFFNTTGPVSGIGGGFDAHGSISQQSLAFAQIYDPELANQMGGYPYLWSTNGIQANSWMMYDAFTGNYICSIANVTQTDRTAAGTSVTIGATGTAVYGKDGSILRYNIVNMGTTAAPKYYLHCWNTTQAIWWKGTQQMFQNGDYSGFSGNNYESWRPYLNYTFDGSHGYSINVTIPAVQGTIRAVREDQYVIGGTQGSNNEQGVTPGNLWALNLDRTKGAVGSLLWNITFTPPSSAGNKTISMGTVDPEDGVFLFACTQTRTRWGYSLSTGQQIWQSEPEEPMKYYGMGYTNIYQGMLLSGCYLNGGILVCYNITTGKVLWKYEPVQIGFESPFGDYPAQIGCIADGKVYIYSSPLWRTQPLWRGSYIRCINMTNGEEIWKVLHYGSLVIADGYALGLNYYDNKLYCYGKGPTSLTVSAPDSGIDLGKSIVIRGTVTDISAGTKQTEQAARFPNGVPVVSDESQEAWMGYVYAQQAMPTNVKGVEVTINVIDANGNYRPVGTAITDKSGFYSLDWKPDVPGKYTVYASFVGSKAYWPSSSQTAFVVDEPAPTATQQPAIALPPTENYIIAATAAIIIAIAIVGAVLFLAIRKRP